MKAHTFRNENDFLVLEVAKVKLVLFFGYCFFCYRFNATKMGINVDKREKVSFCG
jgi:hypothetical protein